MAVFTEDSDEDSITTTTTAASEHSDDEGFNVEQILSEDINAEGVTLYLVKWEGYTLDRCTWEDRSQFGSDIPLKVWRARKRAAAEGGPPLFHIDEFNEAVELAEAEKEEKARRREAKRRKRGEVLSRSQSPAKKASTAPALLRKTVSTQPAKKKGIAQKPVELPLPAQPVTKAKTAGPTPATKPASNPPQPLVNPSGPARKTAPSGSSLMGTNVPEKKRKQRPRVSGDTPKGSTAPKFKNLSTQNRFQSYSRNEPAPDINALVMIDPKTGKPLSGQAAPAATIKPANDIGASLGDPPRASNAAERRQSQPQLTKATSAPAAASKPNADGVSRASENTTANPTESVAQPEMTRSAVQQAPKPKTTFRPAATSNQPTQIQSAYGRRATPPERRRRSPSPVSPPPLVQNEVQMTDPPPIHPKRLTCRNWQAGKCYYTSLTCKFAHSYVNKTKHVTCYYWYNGDTCNKSAEECDFAHEDTGEYAGAPGTFRRKSRASENAASIPSVNSISVNLERRQQVSPALTPAEKPQGQDSLLPLVDTMDIAADDSVMRMREDLELAKNSNRGLKVQPFLSKNNEPIENVYILMPSDRGEERQLLVELFTGFNCRVYHSGNPQHWDYFHNMFKEKPSLIVIHPDETFTGTVPNFANFILRAKGWVFSFGVHENWDGERTYEARRVFPHGGITFISDDVFSYYPEKAAEMIKEFHAKAKIKPPGGELSKIGARPGIRDWLSKLAVQKMEDAGEDYIDDRYVNCWEAVCDLCPLEDYDPFAMERGQMIPKDDALLWSVAADDLPSFQGLWEQDEAKATEMMAEFFAGTAVERMEEFQRYCFVYQRPDQLSINEEVPASQLGPQAILDQVDPQGWMKTYNHIEVLTPDTWLHRMHRRA